ncbi:MAG: CRTAC1 family protein [Candidatus Poribacteria bacterium]|nr:CRTAC1 family protein [Candidatus Poribacteria bacterium]
MKSFIGTTTERWRVLKYVCYIVVLIFITTHAIAQPATFVDVTHEVGIRFQHSKGVRSSLLPEDMGSGAGFADIDNDGDLDLYIVNIPGPFSETPSKPSSHLKKTAITSANVLYRNNGDGTFTDITDTAKVGDTGYGMGCVFADFNGDGNVDLYVTNYGENVLYQNNGNGTFTDVTKIAGVGCPLWSTGTAFADYDGDNDLDLYVCNYVKYDLKKFEQQKEESLQSGKFVPNALNPTAFEPQDNVFYRNNGDGTFTDITDEAGVAAPGGRSMQAIFSDFDNDNDMDLYVANDTSENDIFRNEGNGTFTDVSADSWAADFRGSMGLAAGDYDADGDIDLFISHWIDQEYVLYSNLLQENEAIENSNPKRIRFVDEAYSAMLAEVTLKEIGWGTSLFDYDNDGDLDIFVANGSTFQKLDQPEVLIPQHNQLFRNEGDGTFSDVSKSTGITNLPARVSRGTAFGDYDNDGDVDIFIANNYDRPTLLRNNANDLSNSNNWLHVKLVGENPNRNAVGAKIQLKTANSTQIREIYAGESYMSANSFIAEFGLGKTTQVQMLQITWTNGKIQTLQNVSVNQMMQVTQKP